MWSVDLWIVRQGARVLGKDCKVEQCGHVVDNVVSFLVYVIPIHG